MISWEVMWKAGKYAVTTRKRGRLVASPVTMEVLRFMYWSTSLEYDLIRACCARSSLYCDDRTGIKQADGVSGEQTRNARRKQIDTPRTSSQC